MLLLVGTVIVNTGNAGAQPRRRSRTVMVYMSGDNNLESYISKADHRDRAHRAGVERQLRSARSRGPGWAGEIKLGTEDTWEPTIAADPSGPYVYAMYNRFGGPKACKTCPPIPMLLRVSSDNGVTWGPRPIPAPARA